MNTPSPYWYLDRWTTKRLIEVLAQNDSRIQMMGMDISSLAARGADQNEILRLQGQVDDLQAESSALVERIKARGHQLLAQ